MAIYRLFPILYEPVMDRKRLLRLALGLVCLVGALQGMYLTIRALFEPSRYTVFEFLLFLLALAGYMFVATASLLLVWDSRFVGLMKWALTIQVPWIVVPGFTYKFVTGFYGSLFFTAGHSLDGYEARVGTEWRLGSMFQFNFLTGRGLVVGVNAAALLMLAGLLHLARGQDQIPVNPSQ